MNNEVLTSIILASGGIIGAYITVRVRRKPKKPEYIDTAFEMYESIIKRQDDTIVKQAQKITDQATELDKYKRRI